MELIITTTGAVHAIYDEALELGSLGRVSIERASHVEPTPHGEWLANLSPVSGPLLGPFLKRSDALAAEVAWLRMHWLSAERR